MVNNTREEVQCFLEPYRPGMAVVEATRNWGLIYDWLEEVLDDVALANPLKVKVIAEARIKTDKISADVLADLLLRYTELSLPSLFASCTLASISDDT